jgi:thiamine biosynthesis lipoprotein
MILRTSLDEGDPCRAGHARSSQAGTGSAPVAEPGAEPWLARTRVEPGHPELVEVRRVQPVMGTVVSIAAWGAPERLAPVEAGVVRALAWLHEVDDRFTTWRPSEWLRMAHGELAIESAHPDVALVLDRCRRIERDTDGAFTLRSRPGIPLEPAAFVKGWSAQRAADLLMDVGAVKVCINCGGDVVVAGGDEPWRIGIQDPFDNDRLRGVVEITRGAVATSGLYARGEHLVDARTGGPARGFASVTVVGPDLGLADAYGTALFAAGPGRHAWFERLSAYSAYCIGTDGEIDTVRFS